MFDRRSCGVRRQKEPSGVICGGVTDNTDRKAPKTIVSKDITAFSASMYLLGRWSGPDENMLYDFEIKKNEDGKLFACEKTTGIKAGADKTLLSGLQKVIDDEKLAEQNGLWRVTAGLPPEFQEISFSAEYASGATLRFTCNNDPFADWPKRIYLVFADWFAGRGIGDLLVPKNDGPVKSVSLEVGSGEMFTEIRSVRVREENAKSGETLLLEKNVFDGSAKKNSSKRICFPADYYKRISEILAGYDLRAFDRSSVLYGLGRDLKDDNDKNAPGVVLHIEYENGDRLLIEAKDKKDTELLKPVTDALLEYYASIFG